MFEVLDFMAPPFVLSKLPPTGYFTLEFNRNREGEGSFRKNGGTKSETSYFGTNYNASITEVATDFTRGEG